jgi:hypothetical protein
MDNDFDQPIRVAMYPSAVTSMCEWPTHRGSQMILD